MPSLLRALTPYEAPPHISTTAPGPIPLHKDDLVRPLSESKNGWRANAPETALHSPNSFRRPIITLFPSTALIKNFRSASIGWVPTLYLGKPSKGFYRAICAIGFAATPSSPGVVKIARDEMVEITSVSSETWNYKKLDGSGVTGLVSPTCLVKVELDTEPPAYPPLNLEALANFQDPPRRDIIAMKLRALQKERKHDLEGLEMAGMH